MENQIHQMEKKRYSNVEQSDCSVKFQVYGEAMLDKEVRCNGSCGRIYLPGDWVGPSGKDYTDRLRTVLTAMLGLWKFLKGN